MSLHCCISVQKHLQDSGSWLASIHVHEFGRMRIRRYSFSDRFMDPLGLRETKRRGVQSSCTAVEDLARFVSAARTERRENQSSSRPRAVRFHSFVRSAAWLQSCSVTCMAARVQKCCRQQEIANIAEEARVGHLRARTSHTDSLHP